MTFQPGKSGNKRGRPPGSPNKLTKTVKEAFENVFNNLQDPSYAGAQVSLEEWAVGNPTEFYKLAKALIPTKVEGSMAVAVNVVSGVPEPAADTPPVDFA